MRAIDYENTTFMRTATTTTVYEHPLNDQMRICLRLEHLHEQFQSGLSIHNETGSHLALISLLKTINVIDRPDIKSKLVQILTQHASSLAQLEQFPQVDGVRLRCLLDEIDFLLGMLHEKQGKIGEKLRQNDFLNQIRLQLNNPAGPTSYRNPAYASWIAKSFEKQYEDLSIWANEFKHLYKMADIILKITRTSTDFQSVEAQDGFYQQALDASLPVQLLQVRLEDAFNCYPEISVGKHRLNIRFLIPNYTMTGRAVQSHDQFIFQLNCCR